VGEGKEAIPRSYDQAGRPLLRSNNSERACCVQAERERERDREREKERERQREREREIERERATQIATKMWPAAGWRG
jgi:hypothetical protein